MDKNALKESFPESIPFPVELGDLCDWVKNHGYPISGYFELFIHQSLFLESWFGTDKVNDKFGLFGRGSDGSMYAIWKENELSFPVVHMGPEGQNCCVIANSMKEFLQLLAIGYGDIGDEDMSSPPKNSEDVNVAFQEWVRDCYRLEIPHNGLEITKPSQEQHSDFNAWIETVVN